MRKKSAFLNWRDPTVVERFHEALRAKRNLSAVAAEMDVSYSTVCRKLDELLELLDQVVALRERRADHKRLP